MPAHSIHKNEASKKGLTVDQWCRHIDWEFIGSPTVVLILIKNPKCLFIISINLLESRFFLKLGLDATIYFP